MAADVSKSTVLILLVLVMTLTVLSTLAVLQELQNVPDPSYAASPPMLQAKVGVNILPSTPQNHLGRVVLTINSPEAS